eukprot:2053381-Karenia_brevis.AAC.1
MTQAFFVYLRVTCDEVPGNVNSIDSYQFPKPLFRVCLARAPLSAPRFVKLLANGVRRVDSDLFPFAKGTLRKDA